MIYKKFMGVSLLGLCLGPVPAFAGLWDTLTVENKSQSNLSVILTTLKPTACESMQVNKWEAISKISDLKGDEPMLLANTDQMDSADVSIQFCLNAEAFHYYSNPIALSELQAERTVQLHLVEANGSSYEGLHLDLAPQPEGHFSFTLTSTGLEFKEAQSKWQHILQASAELSLKAPAGWAPFDFGPSQATSSSTSSAATRCAEAAPMLPLIGIRSDQAALENPFQELMLPSSAGKASQKEVAASSSQVRKTLKARDMNIPASRQFPQ